MKLTSRFTGLVSLAGELSVIIYKTGRINISTVLIVISMQITLYRHAEPEMSGDEIISGSEFPSWVQKYNDSGVKHFDCSEDKLDIVFLSNLLRSYETAKFFGKEVKQNSILREAEIPLLSFPSIKLPAKYWLFLARILWFCGVQKNCESFSETKQRTKIIADNIENILQKSEQITIIGHGFINRFIEKEFTKRNWIIKKDNRKNKYFGKVIISKLNNHTENTCKNHNIQ